MRKEQLKYIANELKVLLSLDNGFDGNNPKRHAFDILRRMRELETFILENNPEHLTNLD